MGQGTVTTPNNSLCLEWMIKSIWSSSEYRKVIWSTIIWLWIYGKSSMISSKNAGDIHITNIYGEQVAIEKINTQLSKKGMGVWQNSLGDMTEQTKDLQNKI